MTEKRKKTSIAIFPWQPSPALFPIKTVQRTRSEKPSGWITAGKDPNHCEKSFLFNNQKSHPWSAKRPRIKRKKKISEKKLTKKQSS